MSASSYLANHGVSMQQARDFVLTNLDNPGLIYRTAEQFGVSNEMLGEIVGGYSGDEVEAFFDSHGFAGAALDSSYPLLSDDMMGLANLVSLNNHGGVLSVVSLREQVIAQTGRASYEAAFDPDLFEGAADGVFTAAELGVAHLGNLPATMETVESLLYGTLIKAFKAVDQTEADELVAFVEANEAGLMSGDEAVLDQLLTLVVSVFEDPAAQPILSDDEIAEIAVLSGTVLVELVGQGGDLALFDGLLTGFIG